MRTVQEDVACFVIDEDFETVQDALVAFVDVVAINSYGREWGTGVELKCKLFEFG